MADLPRVRVVTAEIQRGGRYLITQRKESAVLPLLWEFPGGRVYDGETDREALVRACRDRIGVAVEVGEQLMETVHTYPEWEVVLTVHRCAIAGEPWANNVAAVAWVAPDDFGDYPFPGADQATIAALLDLED